MRSYKVVLAAGLLVAGFLGFRHVTAAPYEVTFVMPSADHTFVGASVLMRGQRIGKVAEIGVRGGSAVVKVEIDHDHQPLRSGTTARIGWESLIGARIVDLTPGPDQNPALPSGKLILGQAAEPVELDQVLAALDAKTRAHLQGLVKQLNLVVDGRGASDINRMLKVSGPLVAGIGAVTEQVGHDGPAIQSLVDQLHVVTSTLASRRAKISATVGNLDQFASQVATEQSALSGTLAALPTTVETAQRTLDGVPGPARKAGKLLREIRPATDQLPALASGLSPLLRDLRPVALELRPAIASAAQLLAYTPGLLDNASAVLPTATSAVSKAAPMVDFLRPYTPELAGWLTNWTSIFGSQAASGNYARALITVGGSSFNNNPGVFVPGQTQVARPLPGSNAQQAWDANGDAIQ